MEKTKWFQAPTKPEAPLVSNRGGRVITFCFVCPKSFSTLLGILV